MRASYCYDFVTPLYNESQFPPQPVSSITFETRRYLLDVCDELWYSEYVNAYSNPMVWIGMYIAVASFFCTLAMAADLLHGFRNKKFWFPCKYFTLNAASITVITVTMKLPVDLSSDMPGLTDQGTKLLSMAFMCTMMANLMPSLASMDNNTLLANVIGLAILVITMLINVCIQISTGAIEDLSLTPSESAFSITNFKIWAYIYAAILLWLLLVLISSAIALPTSKQNSEVKYQATSKRILNDEDDTRSTVENLRQYVRRYWVMAESGSPQFVMVSNTLSSTTCGILCVISLTMYIVMMLGLRHEIMYYGSHFKWSILFIAITQTIGVVVGSIAPIFRCFAILNFKLFTEWNKNNFVVFKVEKYWIQMLSEWKESGIPFLSSGRRSRIFVHILTNLILNLCIGIQKVIVVSSKMMGLIPIVLLISIMYCSYCWKLLMSTFFTQPTASIVNDIQEDLSCYAMQLEGGMELGERTLKYISNSINHLIEKAEKEQHKELLLLLEASTGFKGVENFDNDRVETLISVKLVNSWSLPIVTLTSIAVALPNIRKNVIDSLLKSVGEGLFCTHLVEESLNNTCEYENIRKATITMWREVEEKSKWLGNTLERSAYKGKTSIEILEWFGDKAQEIVMQISRSTNIELMENCIPKKLILANSMYRITQSILLSNKSNLEYISEEKLFALLSNMIADILSACFTNLPRVIKMKCHGSYIEKRGASVEDAAKLFGRTEEIIKRLDVRTLPSMDHDKMGFIDEWRLHKKQSFP